MTDYKQLCAELVEDLALWLEYDGPPSRLPETEDESYQLLQRARAALAEPKPPSLKEQALALLDDASDRLDAAHENTIRRALEQLND